MVSLKLQKRLAASVLKCGVRKVWLDPNEVADIFMANSRVLSLAICVYTCGHSCLVTQSLALMSDAS
jgi:hypothetical protein